MFKIILLMLISINIHTLASNTWFEKKSKNVFVLMFGPQIMNVDKIFYLDPGSGISALKLASICPQSIIFMSIIRIWPGTYESQTQT